MLGGADGASVLAFLESLLDRWATSSLFWVVTNFRPFLKFVGRTDLVNALNLAGIKRFHAIDPVLGDCDEERVVRACASGVVSAQTPRSPCSHYRRDCGPVTSWRCGWVMSTAADTRSASCSRRRATR